MIGFYLFLHFKHSFFQTGFFIGIFLFYWIGLSFRYYNLTWLIPLIILVIGIGYGLIFWILNKLTFKYKILWIFYLGFIFDYIRPFTFDWFKPEIFLVNSYFGITKLGFLLFLFGIYLLKNKKLLAVTLLVLSIFLKIVCVILSFFLS